MPPRTTFGAAIQQVTSLPTASAAVRGTFCVVKGNGTTTADTLYCCLMSSTGTYSWKSIVSG